MNYQDVRDKIKTGDMILYVNRKGGNPRTIFERWAVTHGTASPYIHVGVAWVEHERVFVMDISLKGCAPKLLSSTGQFDWAPAPKELSETALRYAFEGFGEWEYSRWQAVLGEFGLLDIGKDRLGQCAEYALSIWQTDGMAPSEKATPAACADGALSVWKTSITRIEQ